MLHPVTCTLRDMIHHVTVMFCDICTSCTTIDFTFREAWRILWHWHLQATFVTCTWCSVTVSGCTLLFNGVLTQLLERSLPAKYLGLRFYMVFVKLHGRGLAEVIHGRGLAWKMFGRLLGNSSTFSCSAMVLHDRTLITAVCTVYCTMQLT